MCWADLRSARPPAPVVCGFTLGLFFSDLLSLALIQPDLAASLLFQRASTSRQGVSPGLQRDSVVMSYIGRWQDQNQGPREPDQEAVTQVQRQAELEETARRYRELKRAMGDMMFVVDGTGRFLDMNERFAQRIGYGASELVAMKLYEVVEGEAEDPRQKMMPFFARSGGRQTLQTKDGGRLPVLVSSVGRYTQAGQFAGALVVCRDAADQAPGAEAIADAAQEMNQPLSGIYGYSELLKGSVGAQDPAYRYAKKIYEQSERLASLVKRIKAQQGEVEGVPTPEPPDDEPSQEEVHP